LTALKADVNIPLFSMEWPNYDFSVLFFLCPPVYTWGYIVFALFVGLFVCWFAQTLTLAKTFAILKIAT